MIGCTRGMSGFENIDEMPAKYRDNGLIPYSNIGGKFFYRETDIQEILNEGLIKRK